MRFFVISDIHGSVPAFRRAMEAFDREKADHVVCAGDFLYHGPRNPLPDGYDPKELAPLLNAKAGRMLAARGNCDSEVDQMLLDFPCMGDYLVFFSAGRRFFLTHGHRYTPEDHPPLVANDVFISGHTHVPTLERRADGIVVLNPGSVSLPKGGSEPSYAVIDDERIILKTIDGRQVTILEL